MEHKTKQIATICRWFRMEVLELTLLEICEDAGVKVGTLSNFEQGRSTNITHLYYYLDRSNNHQKTILINKINSVLKGENNDE